MAERKFETAGQRDTYLDYQAKLHRHDVDQAIKQGWFRVPAISSIMCGIVDDIPWQRFRGQKLKGQSTDQKLCLLLMWLWIHEDTDYQELSEIQVKNYVGALKRGGFVAESIDPKQGHATDIGVFPGWVVVR